MGTATPGPESLTERDWLAAYGIRPKKRLGQNFLMDPRVVREMVRRASFPPGAPVLEIGAGGGPLTAALLSSGRKVTAVECDPGLCLLLRGRFPLELSSGSLDLREEDVLALPSLAGALGRGESPRSPEERPFLAGNLPYGITTAILQKTLAERDRLAGAVLMVQREYGERLLAKPGEKAYGSLTVWAAAHARIRLLLRVGRSAFWPRPGVESAVLELLFPDPAPFRGDSAGLERLLRAAFGQRRKMLENALAHGLSLSKGAAREAITAAGCRPTARAEELDLEQFARLLESIKTMEGRSGT